MNAHVERVPADGEDARRMLAAFVEEIGELYPGWGPEIGPTADPHELAPPDGCFVVAYIDGRAVGGGALKRIGPEAAEIKRVYVAPEARRSGLARWIMAELESFAREAGYAVVRLDTGDRQPGALTMFRALGYREIGDYNANPYARFWFEKVL